MTVVRFPAKRRALAPLGLTAGDRLAELDIELRRSDPGGSWRGALAADRQSTGRASRREFGDPQTGMLGRRRVCSCTANAGRPERAERGCR